MSFQNFTIQFYTIKLRLVLCL